MALIPPQAFFPHTVMLDVRNLRLLLGRAGRAEAATILAIFFFTRKSFYAGFYCWKTPDSDLRRRASSDAR
jgi:hypothetical protein